jgi:hypothetical protein
MTPGRTGTVAPTGTINRNYIQNVDFVPARVRRISMEPKLQDRPSSNLGWVLSPDGATVEDAVSTARLTNAASRQILTSKGFVILTVHSPNDVPGDYWAKIPTIDDCHRAVKEVNTRKPAKLKELREALAIAKEEPLADLPPSDRSYWRVRIADLGRAIEKIEKEDCTGQELHRAFRRESAVVKSREIDKNMRAQIDAYDEVREEQAVLAEEDAGKWGNDKWGDDPEDAAIPAGVEESKDNL